MSGAGSIGAGSRRGLAGNFELHGKRGEVILDDPRALHNSPQCKKYIEERRGIFRAPFIIETPAQEAAVKKKQGEWIKRMEGKNFSTDMSQERISLYYFQDCALCHATPTWDKLSGVDRVFSGGGHTEDNIIPACGRCNLLKLDHDLETFIRLAGHRGIEGGERVGDELMQSQLPSSFGLNYDQAKHSVIKVRGLRFDVSRKKFNDTIKRPCYLCKKRGIWLGHSNSLDRRDPNDPQQYSGSNIEPCCTSCNMGKGGMTVEEFRKANVAVWRAVGFLVQGRQAAANPQKSTRVQQQPLEE